MQRKSLMNYCAYLTPVLSLNSPKEFEAPANALINTQPPNLMRRSYDGTSARLIASEFLSLRFARDDS
jgi:hypothetical protein